MLPGMVYGKIVMPPVRFGATVKSVDDSAAKRRCRALSRRYPRRKTGTTTGWVVAVANTYANAGRRRAALKVTYDGGPNAKLSSESLLNEANVCRDSTIPAWFFSRTAILQRLSAPRRR